MKRWTEALFFASLACLVAVAALFVWAALRQR